MSLLPFVAIAFGTGTAALLARNRPDVSGAIGLTGLLLAAVAGAAAPVLERVGGAFAAGAPAGSAAALGAGTVAAASFVAVGAACGFLIVLAGAGVGTVPRSLPGATLVALGSAGLALVTPSPGAALLFAAAAGATSLVPVLDSRAASDRAAVATAVVLRAVVLAALVAFGGVTVLASPGRDGVAAGLALLGLAAAAGLRFGVVPLHRPAARFAGHAPTVTLPIAAAWAPAAFALVVVAAASATPGAGGTVPAAPFERAVVAVLGLAGVALASAAVVLHDDLDHIVGYALAADGAVALLALGWPAGQPAIPPLWGWLPLVAVSRTALAAWLLAAGGPAGTRRLAELAGWARRSPALAVVLLAIAAASVGWPGSVPWDARAELVGGVVDGPVGLVVLGAVVLGPALVWLRLLAAGVQRPLPGVAAAGSEWRGRLRLAALAATALAVLALAVATGLGGAIRA